MTPRAWAAFGAVSVLWGIPYYFIKVVVDDGVPPLFLAWARVVLAAVLLLALAWRAGVLPSLRGHGRIIALYAILEIAIPFPLIGEGERHISSSLTAILIASVPLFVALLAIRFDPSERVTGRRLVGLLVGLLGVVALVGIDVAGDTDELLGAGAVLLAALGYASGPMLLNTKLKGLDMRAIMGSSLLVAAVVLTPFALANPPDSTPPTEAFLSVVVLAVLCTGAAFMFFGMLIAEVGPSRASVITYVAPIVALALGVLALDERPGPGSFVGLVLIVAGSWLATRGRKAVAAKPAREPTYG